MASASVCCQMALCNVQRMAPRQVQQALGWTGPAQQAGSRARWKDFDHQAGSAGAGQAAWCKAGTLASALSTSGAWGSVGHRPVLPLRVPHDPPPHNQIDTASPGLAVGQAAHHPAVAGRGGSMALQHTSDRP